MSNENQAKPVAAALPASNEFEELRKLAMAATPGPWIAAGPSFGAALPKYCNEVLVDRTGDEDDTYTIAQAVSGLDTEPQTTADMEFIAAANPAAILRLIELAATPALPVVPESIRADFELVKRLHGTTQADTVDGYYGAAFRLFYFIEKLFAAAPELPEGNQQPQTMADHDSALHAEPAGQRCISPLATRPILYTDTVNGAQTCRDDLWAVTTEELNELATRCRAEGGVTSDKAPVAPSHAASTEPVPDWKVDNLRQYMHNDGSGFVFAYDKDGIDKFFATQAAQLTEQDAARLEFMIAEQCIVDEARFVGRNRFSLAWPKHNCVQTAVYETPRAAIDAAILANQSQEG